MTIFVVQNLICLPFQSCPLYVYVCIEIQNFNCNTYIKAGNTNCREGSIQLTSSLR
jgi:hypothetical protein